MWTQNPVLNRPETPNLMTRMNIFRHDERNWPFFIELILIFNRCLEKVKLQFTNGVLRHILIYDNIAKLRYWSFLALGPRQMSNLHRVSAKFLSTQGGKIDQKNLKQNQADISQFMS